MSAGRPFPTLRVRIPVAWGEQDGFGHLNNIVYFRHMESARMHFLRVTGVLDLHQRTGVGVILAATDCRFLAPVQWPDTLTVETGVTHLGNTSFTMDYVLTNGEGTVVAEGEAVLVMYDYPKATKVPVPDPVREAMQGPFTDIR